MGKQKYKDATDKLIQIVDGYDEENKMETLRSVAVHLKNFAVPLNTDEDGEVVSPNAPMLTAMMNILLESLTFVIMKLCQEIYFLYKSINKKHNLK